MKNTNLFYERLTGIVEERGSSLKKISNEMGYPKNTLYNYKNGKLPSGVRLIELAHYLKTSPEYLLGMVDNKKVDSPESIFLRVSKEDLEAINYLYQKVYLNNDSIESDTD